MAAVVDVLFIKIGHIDAAIRAALDVHRTKPGIISLEKTRSRSEVSNDDENGRTSLNTTLPARFYTEQFSMKTRGSNCSS